MEDSSLLRNYTLDQLENELKRRKFHTDNSWLYKCAEANGVYLPADIVNLILDWLRVANEQRKENCWRIRRPLGYMGNNYPGISVPNNIMKNHEHGFRCIESGLFDTVVGLRTAPEELMFSWMGAPKAPVIPQSDCIICEAAKYPWMTGKRAYQAFKFCSANYRRFVWRRNAFKKEHNKRVREGLDKPLSEDKFIALEDL